MEPMRAEPIGWSEEKFQCLQAQLAGEWAEDIWPMKIVVRGAAQQRFLRFDVVSSSLKTEIKYALWSQFEHGQWKRGGQRKRDGNLLSLYYNLQHLIPWLNQIASTTYSLMERSLEAWTWSLRIYLVENNLYRLDRHRNLSATHKYTEYVTEDRRISLFQGLYQSLADAYDDRPETAKDLWDMRRLGLAVNRSASEYALNFAPIAQPWLRQLTKQFIQYNMAVHSPGDCTVKLRALRRFSRFLGEYYPEAHARDIDRSLIVKYIGFLREQKLGASTQNGLLVALRAFLETCTHHLGVEEISKETLIFAEDFAKGPEPVSRAIPEEVLIQLREHLSALPTTTILRMVVILLECGMRLNEICSLPLNCLICDDKHEWYLRFYQSKSHREHTIPLVDEKVVGTIQAQQQEIRAKWGTSCPYLFPSLQSHLEPFKQCTFTLLLNRWAMQQEIKDRNQAFYHFTAHQFRHSVGMRLLNDDVPLEIISRLLGHSSLSMTERYARVRAAKLRVELERIAHKRKTVDYQGRAVKGDPAANDPEAQMVRKGIRGQTLPVGGCGRLVVLGECNYANKCLTCPMWLTSTDDVPALKSFYERAVRLKQRAIEKGNQFVIEQQERIITSLSVRMRSLESAEMDGTLAVDDILAQLRTDLLEAETGLEEVREAGFMLATKHLERTITELKARIAALEEPA